MHPWSHPAGAAAAAAVALTLVCPGDAAPQATDAAAPPVRAATALPVWRSGIELVALQVTVEGRDGRPVQGLSRDDFTVFENGVRRTIATFATAAAPLDLMLLVDISGSMNERMAGAGEAVSELLHTLRFDDRGALVLFSDEAQVVQSLTHDIVSVERALPFAAAHGGTALNDAVDQALRALVGARQAGTAIRRQTLIVISDGEDTASTRVSLADVLAAAGRSGVTVFTITPSTSRQTDLHRILRRRHLAEAEFVMQSLAEASGGRAFTAPTDQELSAAFRHIAAELRCQYWLGYEPDPATAAGRHLSVTIARHPQWRVRTAAAPQATNPPAHLPPAESPRPDVRGRDRSTP